MELYSLETNRQELESESPSFPYFCGLYPRCTLMHLAGNGAIVSIMNNVHLGMQKEIEWKHSVKRRLIMFNTQFIYDKTAIKVFHSWI